MTKRIQLEKAAEGEAFGSLAVPHGGKSTRPKTAGHQYTTLQRRAFVQLLRMLFAVAKKAGAERKRVRVGGVSLRLQERGKDEILSVRGI
jgi:hypothetical protein